MLDVTNIKVNLCKNILWDCVQCFSACMKHFTVILLRDMQKAENEASSYALLFYLKENNQNQILKNCKGSCIKYTQIFPKN